MNIEIANRLVKLRKEKGLSQEQLAEELGLSRQAVSKWERAESSPDTDNLICLAKLYNVSLDELLMTDDDLETIKEEQVKDSNESIFNINSKGIYIKDEDDEVKISVTGIKIKDKNETVIIGKDYEEDEEDENLPPLLKVVNTCFPILCVIIYILIGVAFGLWHPGWIVFLLIPCWYTLVDSIRKKNASEFAYPVFITFIYILLSDIFSIWHPLWILYLTIPIYYAIVNQINKHK